MSDELSELRALSLKLEIDTGLPLETLRKSGDAWVWTWRAGSDVSACDAAAQVIVDAWAMDQPKAAKTAEIDAAYINDLTTNGITVSGITMAATDVDRTTFSEALNVINAALAAGAASTDTDVAALFEYPFLDLAGAEHTLTLGQYRAMCLGYAAGIGAKRAQRRALLAQIAAATTVAEVNAITWES